MSQYDDAVKEVIKGVQYLIETALYKMTKVYNGVVISEEKSGKWEVQFNGEKHEMPAYGGIVPRLGQVVKVIVPQNNMSIAFFI